MKTVAITGGIVLWGFFFLVLVAMKAAGLQPVAAWTWWQVTAPVWVPWGVVLLAGLAKIVIGK